MAEWLLLLHQLPPAPSSARVKTWRRLHDLGAVAIRNAVYVLPNSTQALEDFAWVKAEIVAMRGHASVMTADAVDDADRRAIVDAFRAARAADFAALRKEIARASRLAGRQAAGRDSRANRRLNALADTLRRLDEIDFFAAEGGPEARQALSALEERVMGKRTAVKTDQLTASARTAYTNRTWVTRRRPGVDRMSSAWLIRRFVDSNARFAFAARDAEPPADQVAFDMFTGEFTHQGKLCTFEVLLARFGLDRPSLTHVAEIVHDIDLKEQRYQRAETPTVAALVEGIRQSTADDNEALARGMAIFDALFQSFETAAPKS